MNKVETLELLTVLQTAYPQFYAKKSDEEMDDAVALYMDMFEDEPANLVAMAVKALIKTRTSTWPPSPGEINEKIMQITQPEEMTEQEAWALVSKAVQRSTYGSVEEFAKLPPEIQAVVHDPGQLRQWAIGSAEDLETVIASNFMRSYRAKQKSIREYIALPTSVKQMMITAGFNNDPTEPGLVRMFGGVSDAQRLGASRDRVDREDGLPLLDAGEGGI